MIDRKAAWCAAIFLLLIAAGGIVNDWASRQPTIPGPNQLGPNQVTIQSYRSGTSILPTSSFEPREYVRILRSGRKKPEE
ncbi:hypothetical protein [Paenibacillus lutrae]|uniref:Uncharacterized protein n=1 Tax=Paenibacillus lutrae TaxID=2078573 RepID=A0A7X3K158_9BACL|nr:hypothetical protein [Paenibacillus lutrae]MVP01898.1 hypothetical protein [Paenibacillus lutrae]